MNSERRPQAYTQAIGQRDNTKGRPGRPCVRLQSRPRPGAHVAAGRDRHITSPGRADGLSSKLGRFFSFRGRSFGARTVPATWVRGAACRRASEQRPRPGRTAAHRLDRLAPPTRQFRCSVRCRPAPRSCAAPACVVACGGARPHRPRRAAPPDALWRRGAPPTCPTRQGEHS